ncbi:ArnT family glycosyltransferase [Phaeocystidibacter luteus]|uniref:Glycosyltransferase family 39 protein n=1 Tax=Phaeocystidibacter luteus TaxID=911197 RepID=A0A6N6REX7_9FLAO|nr:glycosyltransferase family 39 protein [Phaeocystidibacter luteus]KAB2808726.1 glycosyltransferase family 39 protein [Phaeocystidibacter luteus]
MKARKSKIALLICFLLLIFGKSMFTGHWTFGGSIAWDVFGYYLYLPATFIQGDPLLTDPTWLNALMAEYEPSSTLYQVWNVQEGSRLIKYPMGMAILYLPSFIIGHGIALLTDAPADGMSWPYQWSLVVGSFMYLLIGLHFTRKILLKLFSDKTTALTLLILVLGTNFLQISTNNSLTAHPLQFALYAAFMWYVIRWYETKKLKHYNTFTVIWGVALLARPSAFVLLPIAVFWGCDSWSAIRDRWRWWVIDNRRLILRAVVIMLMIASPQMVYWFFATGSPIYYSYPNDGFDFLTPYIDEVLFSYRKGWWIYTPLMLLSLIGLIPLVRKNPKAGWPLALFWLFNLYIVGSWNTWWYGGSFGHRAFIDAYPIYAVSIAAVLSWVSTKSLLPKAVLTVFILGCISLNLFQSWQMNHWILSDTYMTEKYYWKVFGKTSVTKEDRMYMGITRGPSTTFDKTLPYELIIDTTITDLYITDLHRWGPGSFEFGDEMRNISLAEHTWWEIDVHTSQPLSDKVWLRVQTNHGNKRIKSKELLLESDSNYTSSVHYEYLTPILKDERDITKLFISSEGMSEINIDSLRVKVFEPTWYD